MMPASLHRSITKVSVLSILSLHFDLALNGLRLLYLVVVPLLSTNVVLPTPLSRGIPRNADCDSKSRPDRFPRPRLDTGGDGRNVERVATQSARMARPDSIV